MSSVETRPASVHVELREALRRGRWDQMQAICVTVTHESLAVQGLLDELGRQAHLHSAARLVLGPRRPWESVRPCVPSREIRDIKDRCLPPLRRARARQQAAIDGRPVMARTLLRTELDAFRVTEPLHRPTVDVVELLTEGVPRDSRISVTGVARPLSGGRLGVGDPGSGEAVEVVGIETALARGLPVEVSGTWHPARKQVEDAAIVTVGLLPDYSAAEVLIDRIGLLLRSESHGRIPGGRKAGVWSGKGSTLPRVDESAALPQAVELLDRACHRSQLSLDTLCRVHKLLADSPPGTGGRLRDGTAIVRRNGLTTFIPPPAAVARTGAESFVAVLATHLATWADDVPAVALAAESIARFTDLHPFADGNGRVARALATWLLLRGGYASRPDTTLGDFCHRYQDEHFRTLRHQEPDPWAWHQFFLDGVMTCFRP